MASARSCITFCFNFWLQRSYVSLRRYARAFTPYDVSVMALLSAISINLRQATLPDVSLPRAAGGAALSFKPTFHRLGFFLSYERYTLGVCFVAGHDINETSEKVRWTKRP